MSDGFAGLDIYPVHNCPQTKALKWNPSKIQVQSHYTNAVKRVTYKQTNQEFSQSYGI